MKQTIAVINKQGELQGFFNLTEGLVTFDVVEQLSQSQLDKIVSQVESGPLELRTEVSDDQGTEYRLVSSQVVPSDPEYAQAVVQFLKQHEYEAGLIGEAL